MMAMLKYQLAVIRPEGGPPETEAALPKPKEPTTKQHQLAVIRPDYETGPWPDIEAPLLERECGTPGVGVGVDGLDIVKAIVYGGLLESITSLGVIASAAAGDASTLNIVALGLANMFAGFVVLANNLGALKRESTTEQYEDELGRPGHFVVHATIAVISYLVFGLMPPMVYGFSFRKSDNKDLKLATVSVASLVCIMLLSMGKAYAKRPPKAYTQTVFYYLTLGVTVSGLGYIAGHLTSILLKKLNAFDSSSSISVPLSFEAVGLIKGPWSSF